MIKNIIVGVAPIIIILGAIFFLSTSKVAEQREEIETLETQVESYEVLIQEIKEEEASEPEIVAPAGKLTFASWYDYSLNGAPGYSRMNATAASRDYERGTMLVVTYQNKSVLTRVNDYGPSVSIFPERGIDLSSYAFAKLAPLSRGVIEVTVEVVE